MGSLKVTYGFATESDWSAAAVDGLIIPVGKQKEDFTLSGPLEALDDACCHELSALIKEEKYDGDKGKLLVFRVPTGCNVKAKRIILMGLGDTKSAKLARLESAAVSAFASLIKFEWLTSIGVSLSAFEDVFPVESTLGILVDAVYQATYKNTEAKPSKSGLKKVTFLTTKAAPASLKEALKTAQILAEARSTSKDLVNLPANIKTTSTLVDAAKALGKATNITVTVQSDVKWIAKNMPTFYEVAKGSVPTDPPKFITLQYKPKGKAKRKIAIVGKSVIFDTGGYQVKPGNSMVTMKGDMTGGSFVIGVFQALSELQPEHIEVLGFMAATPNKIDSDAMIPDSIITSTCGKKVEIRHTDAEGRLTLIDAVAKAAEHKPDEIITVATLTGSAMRAVGLCVALMSNDEPLRDRLLEAAKSLGEPFQGLDLFDSDYEDIKAKFDGADILNTSRSDNRGAQTAAAFVMSGAPEGMPVAHLDIAGADITKDEKATGIGQKTLIQYLLNENAAAGATASKSTGSKAKK